MNWRGGLTRKSSGGFLFMACDKRVRLRKGANGSRKRARDDRLRDEAKVCLSGKIGSHPDTLGMWRMDPKWNSQTIDPF